MSSFYDASKPYNQYVENVLSGKITACNNLKLVCKRYKAWHDRDDIYFDTEDVDRKIRFTERLTHWEGEAAGTRFILLPWQKFFYASIFGFKYKETQARVVSRALLLISRKNGKSSLTAGICLCMALVDQENSPQIGCFSNSTQQSGILFNMASKYARSIDPKNKIFQRYRSEIRLPHNDGRIMVKSSDVESLDGANYSCAIQDEIHMQRNNELYDVIRSSMQSRKQPLLIQITTAGTLTVGYPLFEFRKYCIDILNGIITDDTIMPLLYELDPDDDWKDEKCWIKANPSLGETIRIDKLREEVHSAINNPALEFGVRTKNFNQFLQSDNIWIQDRFVIPAMQTVDLSKLKGEKAYCGVDLASTSDLTAWSVLFPPNKYRDYYPDKYIFKSWVYIPQDAMDNSVNHELYERWVRNKQAFVTPGNVTDYDYILTDQIDNLNYFYCMGIYLDPYNSTQYQISAEASGLPMNQFSQGLLHFNGPTKEFERIIKSGNMIIDKNPVVKWCLSNVELKEDHNNNVKPMKSGGVQSKKIDPVISMIEALGGYLESNNYVPQIYAL